MPVTSTRGSSLFGHIGERHLDDVRQFSIVVAEHPLVLEAFEIGTQGFEAKPQILFADDAEVGRLHGRCLLMHFQQQPVDTRAGLAVREHFADSDTGQIGRVQDLGNLGAAGEATKLGDELADGAAAVLIGVGTEQACKPCTVIPARWRCDRVGSTC